MNVATVITLAIVLFALLVLVAFFRLGLATFQPWLRALLAGRPISALHLIQLWRQGIPPTLIVDAYLLLHYSGQHVPLEELATVYERRQMQIFSSQDLIEFWRSV